MTHIIAISNQKGGVGKTTSAVNISAELAFRGRKVLLIDFDPQGSATSGLGATFNEIGVDIYDMFFDRISLNDVIKPTKINNLSIAPASKDLVSIEIELGKAPGRELILQTQIKLLKETFDYIIIDCPPSSGLLTLNAMGAANKVLIPLQAEYYALEGLAALLETIEFVKQTFNPNLDLLGVFLTMYDIRTNLSAQVEAEAKKYFSDLTFKDRVPRNIRLAECPSHGLPISLYAPGSPGSKAYASIAAEVDERCFGVETDNQDEVANG